jgi:hypothetical protein
MFDAGRSVVEHHNGPMRSGVYLEPTFTKSAIATLHVDPAFSAPLDGQAYAQPLFLEKAVAGKDAVLVATEKNVVTAFEASNGSVLWSKTLAPPVALTNLPCGNIDPLGITGTPYVDLGSRTVYLDAMTTPDQGASKRHEVYALSLDDGATRSGWPVDLESALAAHSPPFHSAFQNQRGALALVDGVLYVPFGGHYGDCGTYYGWVIGIDVHQPTSVTAFNTPAQGGGIWNVAGVFSDATHLFAATGNTFGASMWGGGDGVIRFTKGPTWSGMTTDWWAPANWVDLDNADLDMGTALPVDANAQQLVAAFGKDGKAYLINRDALGGEGAEYTQLMMGSGEINGAATTYTTSAGTFLVVRIDGGGGSQCTTGSGDLVAMKVGSGPSIQPSWCAIAGSVPSTSMSAAGQDTIVWALGFDRLLAFDGETGAPLFTGGGSGDTISSHSYFQSPVIAGGRAWVATSDRLFAFKL